MPKTLQQQLADKMLKQYPKATIKKIDKDNYLDIHIPSISDKIGTHFTFTTTRNGIKLSVYSKDDVLCEQFLENSLELEPANRGIRLKNNPTYETVKEAIEGALFFIGELIESKKAPALKKAVPKKAVPKKAVPKKAVPKKSLKKSKANIENDSNETELDWEIELKKVFSELEELNNNSNETDNKKQSKKNKKQDEYLFIENELEEDQIELFQWTCYDIKGVKKFSLKSTFIYAIANDLFAVKKGELYGVVNDLGQMIVPYKYDQIDKYCEGLARVQTGGRWTGQYGYIDTGGKEVIKCQFDDADSFADGYARVKINEKWGFIKKDGVQLIKPKYSFVSDFSEGLASVSKNDFYGFVDDKDKLVIDFKFDSVQKFKDGVSIVQIGGKMKDGDWVSGKYGLINKKGDILAKCKYDEIKDFNEGIASVSMVGSKGKYGYINLNGKEIIPCIYDFANDFHNGVAFVMKDSKCFLIDKFNNTVSPDKYETISNYYDNLSAVSIDDKYGFIDKKGAIKIKLVYDAVSDFNAGFASFQKNNLWGIMDKNGNILIKPIYDDVEFIPNLPIIIIKANEKSKIIHLSNNFSIPEAYDEIRFLDNNHFICKSDTDNSFDVIPKTDEVVLTKKDLFELLWDKVGGYIYDYKYTTAVTEDEADYIENRGLGCENLGKQKNGLVKIKIKLESYIDTNFKEDFINHFNTDKLAGNKLYQSKELEIWINKCFKSLCDLFSGFSVIGGEVLYPEYGENPWENEKTIYLEVPSKDFKLIDLDKKMKEKKYFLDHKKMKTIVDELGI